MKHGTLTTLRRNRLLIESLKSDTTAFFEVQSDGNVKLWQYSGVHEEQPKDDAKLISINLYTKDLAITRRQEFSNGQMTNDFVYNYSLLNSKSKLRKQNCIPSFRYCVDGKLEGECIQYSRKGIAKSGKGLRNGIPCEFTYEYRRKAKFDDELLRVRYVFNPRTVSPAFADVWWCVPPVRNMEKEDCWVPFARVTQAKITQNGIVFDTKWTYDHKQHPNLVTYANGQEIPTPDMIRNDRYGILPKPSSTSFLDEDPLFPFTSTNSNFIARIFGMNKKVCPSLGTLTSVHSHFHCTPSDIPLEVMEERIKHRWRYSAVSRRTSSSIRCHPPAVLESARLWQPARCDQILAYPWRCYHGKCRCSP